LKPVAVSGVKRNTANTGNAIIIGFNAQDDEERELSDTVQEALRQIEEKNYQVKCVQGHMGEFSDAVFAVENYSPCNRDNLIRVH